MDYQRRRAAHGKRALPDSARARSRTIRLIAALAVVGVLAGIRAWAPKASEAVSGFVSDNLNGNVDYGAALGALGRAVSGEGTFQAVWSALEGESVQASGDGVVTASGGGDFALGFADTPQSATVDELNEAVDPGCEELLLPFPEGDEDEEEDTPDKVSYDYLVLDFDYTMPVNGTKTSGFGYRIHPLTGKRSFHYGVDIGAPLGTAIGSFADGTVEEVGYNSVYGNYMFIRHADGILTFYGHCSSISAVEGQLVKMGDEVAKVGSTGWSTGPHLHFEVRSGDTILDPTNYLSFD